MILEFAALCVPVFGECVSIAGALAGQGVCAGKPVAEPLRNSPGGKRVIGGRRIADGEDTGGSIVLEQLRRGIEDLNPFGPLTAIGQRCEQPAGAELLAPEAACPSGVT